MSDHDGPKQVITMLRNGRSRWTETRSQRLACARRQIEMDRACPQVATIREEITASRDIITLRLKKVSSIFAYLNGDVDERTERILATEGLLGAVTILGTLHCDVAALSVAPNGPGELEQGGIHPMA